MRILLDNVNFSSNSGPNTFASKLSKSLTKKGHRLNSDSSFDIQLSFIMATQKMAPIIQRLDGIYFNSDQDWKSLNEPIKRTYESAAGVIFQSEFNKKLTEKHFGKCKKFEVIHNGTDLESIEQIEPLVHPTIDRYDKVWSCASSWRPHKRLSENVRYFLENSAQNDCLVIAGKDANHVPSHDRIFYVGELNWGQLISLYKRSDYFLHLALMDHCPNVVVDARASGCKIVCSSSGGTKEVSGLDAIVIKDIEWDFEPFKLYDPPKLDFSEKSSNTHNSVTDINDTSEKYLSIMTDVLLGLTF